MATEVVSLDSLMTQHNTQYGAGTIFNGSALKKDPPRLPTGIFALDFATGGGLPVHGTTCNWGPESGGKSNICINAVRMTHSICWDCWELLQNCSCDEPKRMRACWLDVEGCIAEDQEMFDPVSGFVGKLGDYVKQETVSIVSLEDGSKLRVATPSMLYDSGVCETMRIKTRTTELRATYDHPVFVYRDGHGAWVEMQAIAVGDYIARPRFIPDIAPVPSELTADEAELLGLLIGDGSMTDSNRSVSFTGIDAEVWRRLEKLVVQFGYCVIRQDDRHGRIIQSDGSGRKYEKGDGAPLQMFLRRIGLWNKRSAEKFVPAPLLMESKEKIGRLLSGLWMTDGSVNPVRRSLAYSTTSRTLAVQVRWLLQRIGILPRLSTVTYQSDRHADGYVVTVNGYENLKTFMDYVPLYSYKFDMLVELLDTERTQVHMTADCYLPGYSNLEHKHHRELFLNASEVWWDRVVGIEEAGPCRCYDATVPVGSSWVANDVVVHNTLDRDWASAIGADPDRYVVGLADYGEQFVNIADSVLRADDCGLLVIDSLAALVPAEEMEGAAEDGMYAPQSRLIGRMVRKLKQRLIRERKRGHPCAVMFTNQMRIKIGQKFGSPETMPGGMGMKHEFSLLLRCGSGSLPENLKKKYTDKKRNKEVVKRFTFSVKKNKVFVIAGAGEYLRAVETVPSMGVVKGDIEDYNTLMNYAKDYGVVKKDGSSWRYFAHKASTLEDIKTLWRRSWEERMRTQKSIIDRAKLRLQNCGGKEDGEGEET